MSSGFIEKLDSETRDVINYLSNLISINEFIQLEITLIFEILENRSEICDLKIDETSSANQSMINEWEIVI